MPSKDACVQVAVIKQRHNNTQTGEEVCHLVETLDHIADVLAYRLGTSADTISLASLETLRRLGTYLGVLSNQLEPTASQMTTREYIVMICLMLYLYFNL